MLIGTSHMNQYKSNIFKLKVELDDMKFKNVNLDSNPINIKVW